MALLSGATDLGSAFGAMAAGQGGPQSQQAPIAPLSFGGSQATTTGGFGAPPPAVKPMGKMQGYHAPNVGQMNAQSDASAARGAAAANRNVDQAYGNSGFQSRGAAATGQKNFNNLQALGQANSQRATNQLGAAGMQNQFAQGFNNNMIGAYNAESANALGGYGAQNQSALGGQQLDLQKQNQLLNLFSNMLNTTASLA